MISIRQHRAAAIASMMSLAVLMGPAAANTLGNAEPAPRTDEFVYQRQTIDTGSARIAYVDIGPADGQPILFLHGIPSSSYLWRNVLPQLEASDRRLIAVDLVGFGASTGEGYDVLAQVAHLGRFIDRLALDRLVLVTHDWGAGIGLLWASAHADRVLAFATMEGALPPVYPRPDIQSFGPAAPLFARMRDPARSSQAILEENVWIETILPSSVATPLSATAMTAYRAPFPTPESRRPLLEMTASLPIGGEPAAVVQAFAAASGWWHETDFPKLVLYAVPGRLQPERPGGGRARARCLAHGRAHRRCATTLSRRCSSASGSVLRLSRERTRHL